MIELSPGNSIRVTLIDANHCVGAVMFLIEGDGKAVLYTGDIRAETWWVNSIVQNPVLTPYALGLRQLDCIYLDTTFATKRAPYRDFPSKVDGIKELLEKVSTYPDDTIFYFHSWTFGYENVWIALSSFLNSRIHLDEYRTRVYGALSSLDKRSLREVGFDVQSENKFLKENGIEIREAAALCGFRNGNHMQPGCLTSSETVRIHSCERGMGCTILDKDTDAKVVHIIPIISRSNGIDIAELGAGGGKGDLDQKEELETADIAAIGKLMELCAQSINDPERLSKVLKMLQYALSTGSASVDFGLHLQRESQVSENDLSLKKFVAALSTNASRQQQGKIEPHRNKTIRFPYSRHSSYSELCELVAAFKPRDVFPCTVDEATWTPELSMKALFGEYCSGRSFRHDAEMMQTLKARHMNSETQKRGRSQSQQDTQFETPPEITVPSVAKPKIAQMEPEMPGDSTVTEADEAIVAPAGTAMDESAEVQLTIAPDAPHAMLPEAEPAMPREITTPNPTTLSDCQNQFSGKAKPSRPDRKRKMTNAHLAYEAAIGTQLTWADFGGLESTRNRDAREELEL
ncbi:swr1 complex component [Didymella keratinophila]|nr:swr1 complex component [Didymella keratinophila]